MTVISKLAYRVREWKEHCIRPSSTDDQQGLKTWLTPSSGLCKLSMIHSSVTFRKWTLMQWPRPSQLSRKKNDIKEANFATGVCPIVKDAAQPLKEKHNTVKFTDTSEKACLYCEKVRTLSSCKKIEEQEHPERLQFLKSKGLCFGCLNKGHCTDWALKHPTILHKENGGSHGNTNTSSPTGLNTILIGSRNLWIYWGWRQKVHFVSSTCKSEIKKKLQDCRHL